MDGSRDSDSTGRSGAERGSGGRFYRVEGGELVTGVFWAQQCSIKKAFRRPINSILRVRRLQIFDDFFIAFCREMKVFHAASEFPQRHDFVTK